MQFLGNIKSVVLCILDGWGNAKDGKYNAISSASKPCWNFITQNYPISRISTSGLDVGLPKGQMGNSEVGHMNIGSGRIVMQSLQRINEEIDKENKVLLDFINDLGKKNGTCHIIGLVSDGGVHSHQKHISKLATIASSAGIKVAIHAFFDGRDTLPKSAIEHIATLQNDIKGLSNVEIVTACGRYYGMDRDSNFERTAKAYNATAFAQGIRYDNTISLINESYKHNVTDEFIEPAVIGNNYSGINEEDGVLIANFRADRVIQLASALLGKIEICKPIKFSSILGMTEYNLGIPCLFPPADFNNTLGEVISHYGFKQLRIAETEKYAHVTFFFNCGRKDPFLGEERVLIPSPKVATYDLKPEMSAFELTESLIKHINSQEFKLIVVNYANADMVGHTGNIDAAIQAIETVDKCLAKILDATSKIGNTALVITADHGNAEDMFDEKSSMPNTAHTLNPVPFVVCTNPKKEIKLRNGRLCDIAPTVLRLLNIDKPKEMTGDLLISQS
ncbi:2,3-bisphosphoglycerate-independent phosphoglycerate mutase [Candidatus Mesenet endosymbiont of Agriotes lineatus]|uniref:2,3-bisphosphoglycerate-independent phosphoglycerate mutase n=1 Tax=Candidatus Mesenet endosymbiont of Agriotes lineatus TaxID=3077948 RepID=UPI0030D23E67